MARSLAMYGPEKQQVLTLGPVGLAYTHYSDTLEARGAYQPLHSADGRYAWVFDGRIDNRGDLAGALGLEAAEARLASDAMLALLCWQKWGEGGLNRWVGEFAVLAWDRETQTLLAIRDQFGRRPLCFHNHADRIVLASMPKGIHALGDVPRKLDENRLIDVLCQFDIDPDRTYFEGIAQLPAASILRADRAGHRITQYYDLRDAIAPVRLKSDRDYAEEAHALFENAVKARLRSVGGVGALLSSGLDSAANVALAAPDLADRNKRLQAYCWVPQADWTQPAGVRWRGDETEGAQAVAARYPNVDLTRIGEEGISLYDGLDSYLFTAESTVRNVFNLAHMNATARAARAQGAQVLLDGTHGNMTLSYSGRDVGYELLSQGRLLALLREMMRHDQPVNELLKLGFRASPQWLVRLVRRLQGRPATVEALTAAMSAANAGAMTQRQIADKLEETGFSYGLYPYRREREFWIERFARYFTTQDAPLRKAFVAMHGIDVRDPYDDRRLVEWCFGVPESQFCRDGQGRWLMRRVMQGRLPDAILDPRGGKGRQSADWHLRLDTDLPRIIEDFQQASNIPEFGNNVDIQRFKRISEGWGRDRAAFDGGRVSMDHATLLPLVASVAKLTLREVGSNAPN